MPAKLKKQNILQFAGREADLDAIEANIRKAWKDAGHKVSDIETLVTYVKPEDGFVYYVINGTEEGRIELF